MSTQPPDPPDELAAKRAARKKPGTKKGRKENQPQGSTSGPRAIKTAEREAQAVELRLAGVSLTQIAKSVGYTDASSARKAIMRVLSEMLPEETRQEARQRELATLDRLQAAHFGPAMVGDDKSARIVLSCVKGRRELLGLDAPVQLDVRVREGELVTVEFLDVLNDETLAALAPLQEEMVRLSELRAGVIDVEAEELDA